MENKCKKQIERELLIVKDKIDDKRGLFDKKRKKDREVFSTIGEFNEDIDLLKQLEIEEKRFLGILERERKAGARNSYWATDELIKRNREKQIVLLIDRKRLLNKLKEVKNGRRKEILDE